MHRVNSAAKLPALSFAAKPFRTGAGPLSLLLAVVLLFTCGCRKENQFDCLKSTGRQTTDHRHLPAFTWIKVFDNIEVELVKDTAHFVVLHAGENLLANLKAKVEHGVLVLENNNKCNWVRSYKHPVKAVVHVADLRRIVHDGYSTVRTQGTFRQDTLQLDITDAGDFDCSVQCLDLKVTMYETGNITLSGSTELFNFENYGLGKIYARQMPALTVFGQSQGQGDSHVHPAEFLGVYFTGSGNVYYYGNPQQAGKSGPGSGLLIKAN